LSGTSIELSRASAPVSVESIPVIYVQDDFFKLLTSNSAVAEEARKAVLDELDVDKVVIGRLGKEMDGGQSFRKIDTPAQLSEILEGKELGYYHRL